MANKSLFSSSKSKHARANARNEAGGPAYCLAPKHALAQLAATGCFNGTFYTSGADQLDELRRLIDQVDDNVFLAKLALYARQRGGMKDMPAALVAALSTRDAKLLHQVFDRVIDNGRMLRTLFVMVRSGQFGRKGLSSSLKRAFQRWLNDASVAKLLSASIGTAPSLRDVLRMARPTPRDNARRALFGWLTGNEIDKWSPAGEADLPEQVRLLAEYRQADSDPRQAQIVRDLSVRWDLLADAARGPQAWKAIARQMGPQALRMNLNTLVRHEAFQLASGKVDGEMVRYVAARLADAEEISRSRQFPYQYLAAYLNASGSLPKAVRSALHQAAEVACGNVPVLPGPVVIGVDTSGSMSAPVTGQRGHGATSVMRCVDVAALVAAALVRRNPDSVVIPFDLRTYQARIDAQDSILSLAERLAQFGGGGTDCSLPLREANTRYGNVRFAGCILVSDNESWVYRNRPWSYGHGGSTGVLTEWQRFVNNQFRLGGHAIPAPKLICIDLQPYGTTQAPERGDIVNIGGFSDAVFDVIAAFLGGDAASFVAEVESTGL